ncbi:MAG TPA: hypothetical protein VK466_11635, partial [Terriglobales bacterium]|nr:hypothetical protein [Terriglobales bacterium]
MSKEEGRAAPGKFRIPVRISWPGSGPPIPAHRRNSNATRNPPTGAASLRSPKRLAIAITEQELILAAFDLA